MACTIAIDGPAAAGKGTVSKAVAAHFGFAHLDTGLLYRAVGRRTLDGVPPAEAARALRAEDLATGDLRTPEVAQAASKVAVIAEVRAALVDFQRAFARRSGGAVLDGRDIGTVICPEAEVKLYVTASAEVRAQRRFAELIEKGTETDFDTVLADVRDRDARDMGRADAPLKPAEDALLIDTSDLGIDQAVSAAIAEIETVRSNARAEAGRKAARVIGYLEAAPIIVRDSAAMMGHNNPPRDEKLELLTQEVSTLGPLMRTIEDLMQLEQPDPDSVNAAIDEVEASQHRLGAWLAKKLDIAASEFFKEMGKWSGRLGAAALGATSFWAFGLLQHLEPLLEKLRTVLILTGG